MKRWISFPILLAFLLLPMTLATAENVQQTKGGAIDPIKKIAADVCPRFADNPDSFQTVTEKDTVPCVVYGKHYAPKDKGEEHQCYMGRLLGEATPVKLLVMPSGGSCDASTLAYVAEEDKPVIRWFDTPNVNINGYGMGRYDKILKTYGNYTLVTNDRASDLRVLTKNGSYVLCGFINKLHGYTVDRWKSASVCEKFANDDFDVPETLRGNSVESIRAADALYDGSLGRETHVEAVSDVDLDGDGVAEKVLRIQKSSGARCGCEQSRMGLASNSIAGRGAADSMHEALEELTDFGTTNCHARERWSVAVVNGKVYIARNAGQAFDGNEKRRRNWTFSSMPFNDRVLYQYVDGRFVEVCRLKPDSKRYIDHEILRAGELNYTPVE